MSGQLPEGVDLDAVRSHVTSIQILGTLINVTAAYMSAPDGSGEEELREQVLSDAIESVVSMPGEVTGNVLLALLSLIVEVSEPAQVQEWFDHQQAKISEVLDG